MPPAAPIPDKSVSRALDPVALMQIRSLELRARVVVEGFFHGLHKSPHHGFSAEFTEYRPYVTGDDLRYLDWALYARTDRHYIKKYEDETNLRCHLLVDLSRSMEYGSGACTKCEYARSLAATLAWLLHLQGDAIGLMSFDERIREYLPPRHRSSHLRQLLHALESHPSGRSTSLVSPLAKIAELAPKRGMIVLISDLLAPLDPMEQHLSRLRASGHEVIVFQILDPVELDFNLSQPAQFVDRETKRRIFVDPAQARKGYLEKVQAHNGRVREVCLELEVGYQRLTTAMPLDAALLAFLKQRTRRGLLRQRSRASRRASV